MKNPVVFLEIRIGRKDVGKIVFELFPQCVPEAVENFRALCTGTAGIAIDSRLPLSYVGCKAFCVEKGVGIKFGDFITNSGANGESIYGKSAVVESFSNRHAQAGVLTLMCQETEAGFQYDSRFIITTKRSRILEGACVAIGQVRAGMEIVRAVQQIPLDDNYRPRVPVIISDCGECSHATYFEILASKDRGGMTSEELGKQQLQQLLSSGMEISDSDSEEEGLPDDNAEKKDPNSPSSSSSSGSEQSEDVDGSRTVAFEELARRIQESKTLNLKEVMASDGKDNVNEPRVKASRRRPADDKFYLSEPALVSEKVDATRKRKDENRLFGTDVFNVEAQIRAHKKRIKELRVNVADYEKQKSVMQEESFLHPTAGIVVSEGHVPSEDAKERLAVDADKRQLAREKFNRRRRVYDEAGDVDFINDRNQRFNAKLQRTFGQYCVGLKQNLERGTAL